MIKIEVTLKKSAFNGQPIMMSKVVSVDADESPEFEAMATRILQFNGQPVIYKEQIQAVKARMIRRDIKLIEKGTK